MQFMDKEVYLLNKICNGVDKQYFINQLGKKTVNEIRENIDKEFRKQQLRFLGRGCGNGINLRKSQGEKKSFFLVNLSVFGNDTFFG